MRLVIRLSREKIKRCKKIPEPTDIGKKIRQAKSPEDLVDITLYHGIRYKHPENLLREGFRVPSACQEPAVKTAGLPARAGNASLDYPTRR